MADKLLDSEMLDKEQEAERIKQLRMERVSKLLNPELKAIAQMESSSGRNVRHRGVNSSMHKGASAGGAYGVMPQTLRDESKFFPELLSKYPSLQKSIENDAIVTEELNDNPAMDEEISDAIYHRRLKKLHGSVPDTIYSWHNGVTGAIRNRDRKGGPKYDEYTKSRIAEIARMKARETLPASVEVAENDE